MKKFDVIAIGELNPDLIVTGLAGLPVPGREIMAEHCSLELGSSTAICASGLAALGLKTAFYGKVGNDFYGTTVTGLLEKNKVDVRNVMIDENVQTGLTIALNVGNDRALVTVAGAIEALGIDEIDINILNDTKHIHVGSFFLQKKLQSGLPGLFAEAKKRGVTTSLDCGWDDSGNWDSGIFEVLKYTDIFIPNETESLHLSRKDNVKEALFALSDIVKIAVIKLGPKGACMKSRDEILTSPAYDTGTPVDTTGAGDSFNAGFIYGYINGYDHEKCLKLANACGSLSVVRKGGASSCPEIDEVWGTVLQNKYFDESLSR